MKQRLPSCLIIFLCIISQFSFFKNISAQEFTTEGKEFWFGFMENTLGFSPDTLVVSMSSRFNATATVSIPLAGWSQTVTIPANTSVTVGIPRDLAMASGCGAILPRGCRIQANEKISAYALNFQSYSADATLLIPNNTLGDKYYLNTYRENYNNSRQTQMLIVAAYPNTTIRIIPSVNTSCGNPAGVPFDITLQPGQVYHLESSGDLTGTFLQSLDVGNGCKKFVVFSGNFCTAVGNQCCCDHLFDVNFYTDSWGKNFILPNLRTRNRTRFRVLAQQNGTQVSINGGPVQNLNAGQFYQFDLTANGSLTSNNPVTVMQLSMSGDVDNTNADPFMLVLGPNEQILNEISFNTLFNSGNNPNYYVTIVTKTNSTGILTLDGNPVTGFVPVASNPAYSIATPTVSFGSHTIRSDSGFLAYVYEYASYESFGYSAGANLSNLFAKFKYASARFDSIFCPGDTVFFTGLGDNSIISYEWDFGDGDTAMRQNPFHIYDSLGEYQVKMIVMRQNSCDKDTIPGTIKILGPPVTDIPDDSICIGTSKTISIVSNDTIFWSTGDTGKTITLKPTQTTSYSVYAKNQACAGKPDTFTIKVRDPKVDFSTSSVCFGNPIRFTPFAQTSLQFFSWDFGDGNQVSYTSALLNYRDHTYSSPGNYTVSLAVIDSFGCKDTIQKNVNVFPTINQSFTVNDICLNGTAIINNSTTVVSGGLRHRWDWGDGSPIDTISAPTHNYSYADTFFITYIATSDSGCSDTLVKPIIVYENASADFYVNDTCFGFPISVVNNSSGPPGSTFLWLFGDGNQSTIDNPTHVYSNPGTFQITGIVATQQGCNDTLTESVEIFPRPVASFNADSVCFGYPVQFNNNSSISNGTISYLWSFGDGNSSTQQNPAHTYAAQGTFSVKLTVTSDKNCLDSISKTVSVNPNPAASFTVNDVCNDSTLVANNNSSISSGTLSYLWKWGDGTASVGLPATHKYNSTGNYIISVTVTSDKGCADSTTRSATVILGGKPDFSAKEVCHSYPTVFTNQSILKTGTQVQQYFWDFGDGNSSASQNTTHTYSSYGNYAVKLRLDYGNNCFDSIIKQIQVNPNPVASFTVNDVCNDSTLVANDNSTVPAGTLNYTWKWGDGSASNGLPGFHKFNSTGNYTISLTVISDKGCADSTTRSAIVILGGKPDFSVTEVCYSYPTAFTNQTILKTGTQVQQYFWDFGDGNSSASQNTTHTYSSYGNYAVKLRLDYGNNCFDSIIKQIQVNPNPVASFTVNDVCNDSMLVANDNSTVPTGTLNYTWKWGDGSTSVGLPANHKYNSTGYYTISVTVTSDKGCADSTTRNATVILGGKPDFSATEVCHSYPTVFTNQSILKTGTQVQQYFWDYGDGNSSASQNPNHTYTSHGNYAVKLLLDYGNGCLDSVEKIVKVFEKPIASFTADTVCERNFTQFTNNSSPTGLLYNWDFGDGNSSNTDAPKHLYANDGIYQVKLIARTQESCYDSIIKPVQVLKVGNALFEVNAVCIGNTTFFVNRTDTIATPINSFLWDFGDGTQSNQTNPQKQYNSTGNYQVKMISYFSNGCSDTILKLAIVNDKPVVEVTKKDLSCFNSYDGEINLTPLSGPNPFNFIWSPSLPNASLQQMLAAGKYNVTFTDANNCSDTLSVILYQPDSLTLYIDIDSVLCYGNADGRLRAFVTGGTPPYTYKWSNGVSQLENKNLSSGNYFVTVIDQNGCSISGSAVVPQPQKFEVTLKAEDTINLGESITLQPLYNYPRVNYWMWSPSAGLSCTDCENPVAMPYKDIIYSVIAISDKGCIDTSFTKINVQHTPVIYVPNLFTPNRDDINDVVKVYANYAKEVDFKIFNRWGEKVFEGKSLDEGWDGYYKNELCEPGVYVYTVTVTYLDDKKVTRSGSITLVR